MPRVQLAGKAGAVTLDAAEATATTTDTTVDGTTQTIVATLTSSLPAGTRILLIGWVRLSVGATQTGASLTIRRGALITDAIVGEASAVSVTGSATDQLSLMAADTVLTEPQTYVLTVTQSGGGANSGNAEAAVLLALPLVR